jgi:hypothetical protein
MSNGKISVFGREDTSDLGGLFQRAADWVYGREEVEIEDLKDQLQKFLMDMQEVLHGLPERIGEFQIDSMDISVEVSTKGTVSLMGIGGELGGKGGITFTLKRIDKPR